jgi:predicted PurR-regulated permease PerM
MQNITFNNRIRQVILLSLIILLTILFGAQLNIFLPGMLGGITLYILTRKGFQVLTQQKNWNQYLVATLFIIASLLLIAIPVYFSIQIVAPRISSVIKNQHEVMKGIQVLSKNIEEFVGVELFTTENMQSILAKASSFIPVFLNSSANVLVNILMMIFLYYYLLQNGPAVEKYLNKIIPLKHENVNKLADETIMMIRANAIGIPIISFVQGVFAAIGYLIFGVKDWGMWGFMTGLFAFFPILGTLVIWVPLVIYLYSTGHNYTATGLAIYSLVVTGNVDYITRLGLLKKIGNIHPIITVLGLIVGLKLFGFMGLIFGPLLISYFIILVRIYINEFTSLDND